MKSNNQTVKKVLTVGAVGINPEGDTDCIFIPGVNHVGVPHNNRPGVENLVLAGEKEYE